MLLPDTPCREKVYTLHLSGDVGNHAVSLVYWLPVMCRNKTEQYLCDIHIFFDTSREQNAQPHITRKVVHHPQLLMYRNSLGLFNIPAYSAYNKHWSVIRDIYLLNLGTKNTTVSFKTSTDYPVLLVAWRQWEDNGAITAVLNFNHRHPTFG